MGKCEEAWPRALSHHRAVLGRGSLSSLCRVSAGQIGKEFGCCDGKEPRHPVHELRVPSNQDPLLVSFDPGDDRLGCRIGCGLYELLVEHLVQVVVCPVGKQMSAKPGVAGELARRTI